MCKREREERTERKGGKEKGERKGRCVRERERVFECVRESVSVCVWRGGRREGESCKGEL